MKPAKMDIVEATIEKLVSGGDGLARLDGVPLFVARSAPGDRVKLRIVERHADYGRAEIVELIQPGPGRRDAPCPHYGDCGGCNLQHLDEEHQLRYKTDATLETLRRLGKGLKFPPPQIFSGDSWSYRLRTQVHTESRGDGVVVGYQRRGHRELVPIRACPILIDGLEQTAVTLAQYLPADAPRRLDLATGAGAATTVSPPVAELGQGEVRLKVGDFEYSFDARCFFQAHRGLLPTLIERVVGDGDGEEAFDLYAGVGLFSLPLARRYRRVVAVEGDRIGARYARRNARRNRVKGIEVVSTAVESWIGNLPAEADRVVVDPPRSGLSRRVRQVLGEGRAKELTYVSCHVATMARDLAELLPTYRPVSLDLLDLFPQTGHLELVAQLERVD